MFKIGENNKEIQQEHLTAGAHFAWHGVHWTPAAWRPVSKQLIAAHPSVCALHSVSYLNTWSFPKWPLFL